MKTIADTYHGIRRLTRLVGVLTVAFAVANLAAQVPFTEITDTGDLGGTPSSNLAAAWGDVDDDGDLDLFVGQWWQQGNLVLRNDGSGQFTRMTTAEIGDLADDASDAAMGLWADMDNDGDLDLYIANYSEAVNEDDWYKVGTLAQADRLYLNDGDGHFSRTRLPGIDEVRLYSNGVNLVDYDEDGLLDVFIATYPINDTHSGPDRLFHNEGNLTFAHVPIPGSDTQGDSSSWVDYDGDGDLDALVNDNRSGYGPQIYRNRTGETGLPLFTVTSSFLDGQTLGGRSSQSAWGDYDNDGDLDLFIQHFVWRGSSGGGVNLWTNLGRGVFERREFFADPALDSWDGVWIDYENDGDLDLLLSQWEVFNGKWQQLGFILYEGDGAGGFEPLEFPTPPGDPDWRGNTTADIDNDGFMDVLILDNFRTPSRDRLFRNDGNANHWLKIVPEGTDSNRSAIGAIVRVKATINGKQTWQMRQIMAGDGAPFVQHDPRPNFGLGNATVAEIVRIEFPSGNVQELRDVPVDQILPVTEPPRLKLTTDLQASWSARVEGYSLVSAPSPLGPWTPVGSGVTTDGDRRTADLVADGDMRFYRLEGE